MLRIVIPAVDRFDIISAVYGLIPILSFITSFISFISVISHMRFLRLQRLPFLLQNHLIWSELSFLLGLKHLPVLYTLVNFIVGVGIFQGVKALCWNYLRTYWLVICLNLWSRGGNFPSLVHFLNMVQLIFPLYIAFFFMHKPCSILLILFKLSSSYVLLRHDVTFLWFSEFFVDGWILLIILVVCFLHIFSIRGQNSKAVVL